MQTCFEAQEAHSQPSMKPAHVHNEDNQAACTRKTCFYGKAWDHSSASASTVHKGWLGSKASFPVPYYGMISSQISAERDLALAWTLIILSRLSCPSGTARGQTALPTCPATLDPSPDTAIHRLRHIPVLPHCSALPTGTKQQHQLAVIWLLNITTTSAIQVTIFKLLLMAINLGTQQPNWIYRLGGYGTQRAMPGFQVLILSHFLKRGLNLQGFTFFRSPCYEVMRKHLRSGDFLLP